MSSSSTFSSCSTKVPASCYESAEQAESMLATTLAAISGICFDGVTGLEQAQQSLLKLNSVIRGSWVYSLRVPPRQYGNFRLSLQRKADQYLGKIVYEALLLFHPEPYNLFLCFQLLKAVHETLDLTFQYVAPPNATQGEGPKFKFEGIFAQTKHIHNALSSCRIVRDTTAAAAVPSTAEEGSEPPQNSTPRQLLRKEVAENMVLLTEINLLVLRSCVPSHSMFAYFARLAQKPDFTLVDLEYFEEMLSRLASGSRFAQATFSAEKKQIKNDYLAMLDDVSLRNWPWCTAAQMVDYLQILVDHFHDIYGDSLMIERTYDSNTGAEGTVVRRASKDAEAGAFCGRAPGFVGLFSQNTDVGVLAPARRRCSEGGRVGTAGTGLPPSDPLQSVIFGLNEAVASEVSALRADAEAQSPGRIGFKPTAKARLLQWIRRGRGWPPRRSPLV